MTNDYLKVVTGAHPHERVGIPASIFPFDNHDLDDKERAWIQAAALCGELNRTRQGDDALARIVSWGDMQIELDQIRRLP